MQSARFSTVPTRRNDPRSRLVRSQLGRKGAFVVGKKCNGMSVLVTVTQTHGAGTRARSCIGSKAPTKIILWLLVASECRTPPSCVLASAR
jgi:hypothetical protein